MLPWCASVPSPSPLTLLARSQPDGLGFWRHPACSPVGGDRFSVHLNVEASVFFIVYSTVSEEQTVSSDIFPCEHDVIFIYYILSIFLTLMCWVFYFEIWADTQCCVAVWLDLPLWRTDLGVFSAEQSDEPLLGGCWNVSCSSQSWKHENGVFTRKRHSLFVEHCV